MEKFNVTNKLQPKGDQPNAIKQLSDGGILVLPLLHENDQYLTKVIKKNKKLYFEKHWKVRFVPLVSGIR